MVKKKRYGFEIIKDLEEAERFRDFLERTKGLSIKTIEGYFKYYKFLDIYKIDNKNIERTQLYIDSFIVDKGNTSVLKGMLKNYFEFKKVKGIVLPKITGRKNLKIIRDISQEDIKKIINIAYQESDKKGLIWDLMYQGALRREEIPPIRICDFYWKDWLKTPDDLCFLLVHGKGKKERQVVINPETMQKILSNFQNTDVDVDTFINSKTRLFNFSNYKDKPITEKMVYDIVKRISIKVIGRDIRPHELRHCRATELEKRGMSLRDISIYLGHSSTAITELYLHRSQNETLKENKELLREVNYD